MRVRKELTLITLIDKWIKRDPLLKKHINFSPDFKGHAEIIGTCYPKNKVQYAIGCIGEQGFTAERHGAMVAWVWSWTPSYYKTTLHFSRSAKYGQEQTLHPGDPQFFEKLKVALLKGHDSLALYHKCPKLI